MISKLAADPGSKEAILTLLGKSAARPTAVARRLIPAAEIWPVVLVALPTVALVFLVTVQPWTDPANLLRDPLAVAASQGSACCAIYYGALSSLGVHILTAASAVCLFAALVTATRPGTRSLLTFLIAGGLLTGLMAADDLFMIHDHVLPALGVPKHITYAAYGALGIAYVASSWRQIMSRRYVLFAFAALMLGTSVAIDVLTHGEQAPRIIFEDGAKLVGLTAWAAFHVMAAREILTAT